MGVVTCTQKLNETEVLLSGLYHNKEKLQPCGITSDLIARLEGIHHSLYELNSCQEALQARLEAKTAEIDRRVAELEALYQKVREVITVELPHDSWQEFGIRDSENSI